MADDFSAYPKSLTEVKAARTNDARDATPRDTLIELLREIDGGTLNPYALTVVYAWRDANGGQHSTFNNSAPDTLTTLGMLTRAIQRMCN